MAKIVLLSLLLLLSLVNLSQQLYYATVRQPANACYGQKVENRDVVVQKDYEGCGPDFTTFCEFDWDRQVRKRITVVEVCCEGFSQQGDACVRKYIELEPV